MKATPPHTIMQRVLAGPPVTDLDDFVCRGGGEGLEAARRESPSTIIDLIGRSGLRGRGGAGFPTGLKLRSIADAGIGRRPAPVVVNAAEGEPGTFKDRTIIRHDPYGVIEGALIAAHALGTNEIVIAIKESFTHEIERLETAARQLAAAGVTDGCTIRLVHGPSEYLFGEETALLEVIDGRPPFPRVQAPYRRGIREDDQAPDASPWSERAVAYVSNVETFANVAGIVRHGADWFRELGTAASPGTIVCTVTGDTVHHGVGEIAFGATLRDVIEIIGGGMPEGHSIGAVLSGVSNAPIGIDGLDTPVTYEDMAAQGSGVGSASFIVIDAERSLRAVAAEVSRFLAIESCGQCEPCKRDGLAIADALHHPDRRPPVPIDDLLRTVARGARCALAGQQEHVVGGLLALAAVQPQSLDVDTAEFVVAPLIDITRGRARLDMSHLDKRADWTMVGEEPDSHAWPVTRLADRPVTVRPAHVRESDVDVDATIDRDDELTALATPDAFDTLRAIDRHLEGALSELRAASNAERSGALAGVREQLERHQRVTEGVVYPLVRARLGADGDDVAWYPQHHEQSAGRLLRRLEIGHGMLSDRLIDDLCSDVHASIIELRLRVLPLIDESLADDSEEMHVVEAAVDGLA